MTGTETMDAYVWKKCMARIEELRQIELTKIVKPEQQNFIKVLKIK